jgi:hypothetical protein
LVVVIPSASDPKVIRANIARAKARRDAALTEFEAASRELQWWREGLAMFDPVTAAAEELEEDADARIQQLIPDGFETPDPTMRQIILFAFRGDPRGDWSVNRIYDMAVTHGWIDPEAKDQAKRITDMAALMAQDEVLERVDRGVYRLPQPLAAALSRALRPITDYHLAGRHGLPVPERPSFRSSRDRLRRKHANASDIRTSDPTD